MSEDTSNAPVWIERNGHVAVVTIDRPEARNAVNGAVATELSRIVAEIEADDGLWVTILTGSGQSFCSGADLKAVSKGEGRAMFTRAGFAGFTHAKRSKPWIAAVEGHALAGGLEIALACDMIVAGEGARFGLPEATRGLLAAAGGAYRLPRVLPRAIALEMLATGQPIDAVRAAHFGLVNRVVADGEALSAAKALAASIAEAAPLAVRENLDLARATYDGTDADLNRLSYEANKRLWATEDFKEGPRAFVEKRPPRWMGR